MKLGILICALASLICWNRAASAFWGGEPDSASGLNVAAGFDINTMTSFTGTVLTLPQRQGEPEHSVLSVATKQGPVTIVLGPWWFWEKQGMTLKKTQEIVVTGSLAQGKDGGIYLFAQRLENRASGAAVLLRSDAGVPLWSAAGSGNLSATGRSGVGGAGFGAGLRGSGSGMRGGRR